MSAELKSLDFKSVSAAAVVSGATNGASFDLRPYDGEIRLILSALNTAGTNPTLDVTIEHSEDGTTWVDSGVAFTQATTGASFQVKAIAAEHFRRYIRTVSTPGGTNSPAYGRSVTIVGKLRKA